MRAGIVNDPADYRSCSYGVWAQRGHHPFAEALVAHLIPALPARLRNLTPQAVGEELKKRFSEEAQEAPPAAASTGDVTATDAKTTALARACPKSGVFYGSLKRGIGIYKKLLLPICGLLSASNIQTAAGEEKMSGELEEWCAKVVEYDSS